MTIKEMADYIRKNRPYIHFHPGYESNDASLVVQYSRHEMWGDYHLTEEHIFECCAKANSFDEHIALCKPLAKLDEEKFRYDQRHSPVKKGQVRRRRFK